MTADEALGLAARCAYAAYRNSLVGDPAPAVKSFYDRCASPQVGDIVLETSSVHSMWRNPNGAAGSSLGKLIEIADEPIVSAEDLEKAHAAGEYWNSADETIDTIPKERVYYVQSLLDESIWRWRDADFISLPETWKAR